MLLKALRRGEYEPVSERVETAAQMNRALETASWDIVIADYVLPQFNGLNALRLLRESGSDIPFIMVSGKLGEETAVEVMRAGAGDYILKDNLARLIPVIERELREAKIRGERRQAEAALRESEQIFRLLVDAVEDYAIFMLDAEGRVTSWNAGAQRIKGYSTEEVIGKHISMFYTREDIEHGLPDEALRLAGRDGRYKIEGWRLRKDGSCFWADMVITALFRPDGSIRGYMEVVRDITERKETDEERERLLGEIQRRYVELDATFNAIVDPTATFNTEGCVTRANPAMVLTLGRDPSGMNHAEIARILSMRRPDGTLLEETENPVYRALRGEAVVGERLTVTDVDGHVMILLISAAPLVEKNQYWGVVCIWHDISKRERLFEEVQRRSAELDATLASVADGLIIYSPAGEILLDNPAARRLLDGILIDQEFTSELPQWIARNARTPDGKPLAPEHEPAARAARGDTVIGEVLTFQRKDGTEIWVSVSAAPIRQRDDTIIGVVSTYTDITQLHDLQEQREVYIHTISHDLRAPLAVIHGHTELLRELQLEDQLKSSVEAIQRGITRMNVMI